MVRILHISDFHLKNTDLFNLNNEIIEPLLKDLDNFHTDKKIDFIVCSGDLINKGGEGFDNTEHAFKIFRKSIADKLIQELDLPLQRFILTCGNHDIDRNLDSKYAERGLKNSLTDTESVNEYLSMNNKEGSKRINPFNKFIESFYSDFIGDQILHNRFVQAFKFKTEGLKIGFASFNSSWRCYNSELDTGSLLIGKKQTEIVLDYLSGCDIKIAATHHPLKYLTDFDRDRIKSILMREFDLLFVGHNHEAKSETTQLLSNGLFFSYAPGVMDFNVDNDSRRFSNGYRLIDYDPIKAEVTSFSRRYNSKENRFDPNTDDGNEKGISNYTLPSKNELAKVQKNEEIAERIQKVQYDKFNSQLLSYNTDTIAPKKLDDLFVRPSLMSKEKGARESEYDQVEYTIKDLLSSKKNFLISGIRESGKSCLLNKIVEESTDNINLYNEIPIKIDFNTLTKRRIESEINDFIHVGMSTVNEICENHSILLLIDNIKFDGGYKYAIKKLNIFLGKHPSTRVISTSLVTNQEEIPLKVLKHNDSFKFKFLSLKNFKVQHIRALVEKWFQKSETINTPDKVNNIVDLFKTLSLPRTPLAISILLWIIEKQEDYKPTNESTMLENFIERIFKKHNESEIYSSKFDHKNKTRILSSLAVEMLKDDNENYRFKYSTTLVFFEEYLEARQYPFKAKKILDHFIDVGVLINDESFIRFRFKCFFEFFLMKQMEFEKGNDFKDLVLSQKNYLQFFNEIKYYSGLKRDQADILELLVERLQEEFSPIEEELNLNANSIDEYFQVNNSLLDQIDESTFLTKIESNKPTEEDLDQIDNEQLDLNNPDSGIRKKESPENLIGRLGKVLNLSAQVLKNSEEITKNGLKQKAYNKILDAAVNYTVLYQFELKRFLDENPDSIPVDLKNAIGFIANYTPTILQLSLYSNVGTEKLSYIFEEEIEKRLINLNSSDLEKFFAIFIYAENRGKNYFKKISKLISTANAKYIQDNVLLKLVSYFYLRADEKSYETKFLNLIADLLVKSKGLPKSKKGKIISDFRRKKLVKENSESENQMILDV